LNHYGGGIESTLDRHKAGYHESCKLKFNNTKRNMGIQNTQALQTQEKSLLEVQISQGRVHLHRT